MARHVLFLFSILLSSFIITAQAQVSVDPGSFVLTGNPSQTDISYHVHVTNTSNETLNIYWSKEMINQPSQWLSWICDENRCYFYHVHSCPADIPVVLSPGESSDLQVHLNPSKTAGTGNYELNVLDNNGNLIESVEGTIVIDASTAVKEANDLKLTIFPNPTLDFFEVSETPGLRYIEVFNIIGNKVRSFDSAPQKQYYVGDLTDGIYLVRLVNASNKVIKTVRLSKR